MFNWGGIVHAQLFHRPHKAFRAKKAHEVVFKGDKKLGGTRVSLAPGAAPELVVDAAGFMALGAQDVQAPQFRHALFQDDVGAPTRHVGGDGDRPPAAGLGDNLCLPLMLLGV